MNLIKVSLRYPVVTLVLTTLVVTTGIHAFLTMPRMEDPDVTVRTGLVLAIYPGATSEQVEEQLAKPIEERIFKFAEVRKEKTFSTSRPGLMVINVELEDNITEADVFWSKLRHDMNEASATILPRGVRGPIVNSDFGSTVAVLMAIHGKRYGYRELRDYTDRIQDELRTIRNIGKMATYGEQSEQIRITSSLERMSQYFADPLRVIQALQQRNIIQPSGHFDANTAKVPLRTTGLFTTEEEIRHVLVDLSRTGQPVYVRDFANVERKYQDPTFLVRYDGEPSVLLFIEMQKGKNIVQLGEQIDIVLQHLQTLLPPDLKLDLIANQPAVVKERISDLSHEFMLAIGSVILVTIVLLPIRVAVIAAFAIPVTICTTLGVLNAIGIQLHQVSIAALIVVLGIVVDDAIVIADNYIDLLDRKVPKAEAAWRCATEVIVPVATATLTIISSFLPLLVLTGSAGEFIRALPITVAVALSVSFIVAVMLTPLLCRFFIQKGLHEEENTKKKTSMLDRLQLAYNKAIVFFMARKVLALAFGIVAVVGGALLLKTVPEQFFPTAERNQFVIDIWMPQGSRIEATDNVMRRIEQHLGSQSSVAHVAAFVGQSAPRFYYNVNPQQPDYAYGQIIVNTKSEEETPGMVAELRTRLAQLAPEAMVIVKELQQGQQMEAPVEVRISGNDTDELKRIGHRVEDIFRAFPYAQLVHNDFFNDSYRVDIDVSTELSNRLGLSNASVSQMLAGAFDGVPVSTFWEGDRPVSIVLRLEEDRRTSFENVRDAYVTSQITHASVPLRSIATLQPEWQTSRIVRRNGVRTLTVRGFVAAGHYGSELLKATESQIKALKLPPGYYIQYGGEKANRDETFPQMVVALAISVLAIFLILLIQFRTLSEPLIVMSSIPLALFGASLGLIITRNPFGFTAFMGLISLAGIVVRNAIILIDYINEKIREGHPLEQAATEAGERRLRPIFLTTMAAAVGVTPMILSGSSLWSPLASVIAVGLIFSMFFTLLVVPVLFVLIESRFNKVPPITAVIVVVALFTASSAAAETRKLTLPEAVDLALKQNSVIKIARAKVREGEQKSLTARADYFPQLSTDATLFGVANPQFITVPAGGLGSIPGLGPFPPSAMSLTQSSTTLFLTNTTLGQPLTQLWKIRAANRIAASDQRISDVDRKKAEDEIRLGVHQIYYGLLAAQKMREAAQAQVAAGSETLREAETAVQAGNMLEVAITGSRASLLQSKQALLVAENQIADLNLEMNNLLGLPLNTDLDLADIGPPADTNASREQYLQTALNQNPDIQAAIQAVEKARSATAAARYEYIPEIGAFARYTYQNGFPFITHNNAAFGLQMTWTIFDWGKRNGVIGQREAQVEQAEENLMRIKDRISVDVEKALRKIERAKQMIDVSTEALALRKENERLSGNQLRAGVTSEAKNAETIAAAKKAEADALQARLAYELAQAELERVVGGIPR